MLYRYTEVNINNQPTLLKYWLTNNLSSNLKVINNKSNKSNKSNNPIK